MKKSIYEILTILLQALWFAEYIHIEHKFFGINVGIDSIKSI